MKKIISVVIPTLNRKNYLAETLEHFIPQFERNQNVVELIICNNASDDDTDSFMRSITENKPLVIITLMKELIFAKVFQGL